MLKSSFTFLRVRGIEIGAHWSWLAVLALVIWSLARGAFPSSYPGLGEPAYLAMGAVAGVLFFVSILLHELGHAFRAVREGMVIDGITLWFLGGVARFKGMFPSAGAEFRIAIAGPIVSLVTAGAFWVLTVLGDATGWPAAVQGVVEYLWRINAIVAAFNLVPALPLDGGRILRSWLWHRQQDFSAATRSAAKAGTAFGILLGLVGVLNVLGGTDGGGLWFVFLGWFLIQAARSEATIGVMQTALAGRKVRDVMTPDPQVVEPAMTIAEFFERTVGPKGHSAYPVVEAGRAVGLLQLRTAGTVPQAERVSTLVRDVMVSEPEVRAISADAELLDALGQIEEGVGRAPVEDNGSAVGLLSIADIENALVTQRARGIDQGREPKPVGLFVWLVVGALMLGVAGYLYRPPVIILRPGLAIDVGGDIEISGVETDELEGEYLLTSINVERPTGWGWAWALVRQDEIVAREQVVPPDIPAEEYFRQQRSIFDESRRLAAAAAARSIGMDVEIQGDGASVLQVLPGPSRGHIREGDTIVAVNGTDISVVTDLQEVIRAEPTGTSFEVEVERGAGRRTFEIESAQLEGAPEGTPGLGVVIETRGFNVDLPFEVTFKEREIGGPSAGLICALVIADLLDHGDFAEGRTIAATGSIGIDGRVGDIGGVDLKAEAAASAGASLFLVPSSQADEVSESRLTTRGVRDLEQALEALRSTG